MPQFYILLYATLTEVISFSKASVLFSHLPRGNFAPYSYMTASSLLLVHGWLLLLTENSLFRYKRLPWCSGVKLTHFSIRALHFFSFPPDGLHLEAPLFLQKAGGKVAAIMLNISSCFQTEVKFSKCPSSMEKISSSIK